jgi:HEAT repeats
LIAILSYLPFLLFNVKESDKMQRLQRLLISVLSSLLLGLFYLTFFPNPWIRGTGADGDEVRLRGLKAQQLYAVTVYFKTLAQVSSSAEVSVQIADAAGPLVQKTLHAGDLDFYVTLRPRASGDGVVRLERKSPASKNPPVEVECRPILTSNNQEVVVAAQPNGTWQQAQPFQLGQTIFGSSDERPYVPAPSEDRYESLLRGFQWFKFTHTGSEPRLVYFDIDILDRDVPVDVEIFTLGKDEKTGEQDVRLYKEGGSAYLPEATQNFPGLYKFRTRIIKPGQTYYVRVAANHPAFQLRTFDYPVPPYKDPKLAVRAGMDFLINMGDSWHANTPRRGSVAFRDSMAHAETHTCIACHPTQFTTRGHLVAQQNGYPVKQRHALKFLTERLYNNPRPLYGQPDINWVRVIYSARTVSSRIPYILNLFEKEVSREAPRPGLGTGFGNYLKIHYRGVNELPGIEVDGCSPEISPFEIAAQSWQTLGLLTDQTRDARWEQERQRVEKMILPVKPLDVIDLNWKIAALSIINRNQYQKEIDLLVEQLYALQRENGQWAYKFEASSKPSDFITFHAIWALALAGRRPETDARLAKSVEYCLRAQRPEGSWQGDPVYKGFNTPFRDTQFAVMALSQLYPGPGGKGWGAAYPQPPTQIRSKYLDQFFSDADQFWEMPQESVLKSLRKALSESDQPLAREAAAAALGRVADSQSIHTLVEALGHPSKVVQRTAAWALREIIVRRGQGRVELASALASPNDRIRWGATRLFNQHFRDLTGDEALLSALIKNLADPVSQIRYHATSGLWRWYYWQIDHEQRRGRVLESVAARLGLEEDATVRRGLMESIYNMLDENTGYLQAWVKASAQEEDRKKIKEGYEAVVRQQSQILAKVLREGNRLTREGVLTALWDFHTRHMAIPDDKTLQINLPAVFTQYVASLPDLHRAGYDYTPYREAAKFRYDVFNGFLQTRIGNDSELIHFFASSGPALEEALLECLRGADTAMKVNVLKAGHTLGEAGGENFALAVLKLSQDADPKVREAVRYVYEQGARGVLNLGPDPRPQPELASIAAPISGAALSKDTSAGLKPELVDTVVKILQQRNEEGLAVLLPLLADLEPNSVWYREPRVVESVRELLHKETRESIYPSVLQAASAFESVLADPNLQDRVLAALNSKDADLQRVAIQIVLFRFLEQPRLEPKVATVFAGLNSAQRNILLNELTSEKRRLKRRGQALTATGLDVLFLKLADAPQDKDLLQFPAVAHAAVKSLSDKDGNVRAAALDLVAKRKELLEKTETRQALERLRQDATPRISRLAEALLEGKDPQSAFQESDVTRLLDFDFFVEKVQPILARPGADGKACAMCHASHAIFKLQPPDYNNQFSENASRENYRYATSVVNVAQPEKSLLLIKPTRPTDSGGDVNDYLATHNGGERWPGNESSPEYQTILQWVRGARATTVSSER